MFSTVNTLLYTDKSTDTNKLMSQIYSCHLSDQLLQFTGEDKKSYLHGQITQDTNLFTNDSFHWAGQCDAKGKLWAILRLFNYQNDFFAITSKDEFENALAEFKKYAVFAKVEITLNDNHQLIGIFGADLSIVLNELNIQFSETSNSATDFSLGKAIKLDNNRVILCIEKARLAQLPASLIQLDNEHSWNSLAILAGEPKLNSQSICEFVPQMVNLQSIGGISFKKGCYKGQETVARMKFLGKNKRAMYILEANSSEPLEATEVEQQLGKNWRRAGKLLQSSFDVDTNKVYALAVMPNDIALETPLRTKQDNPISFTIKALPYSLTEEN
ncbi:tRNA-modifying protein YgfZ [Pseudoalteromonas sp. NBT06-2]|uniref:tRNA-modifying protein YgfZ n=1 Tax=Pseudoalteromonas sp. NBT06-2 TaxID=2025950 RepID=UPI0020754A4B|nr:tRNA-modifying protein YgfZ [Pseudoalteromonas sp. NBT06-2]